MEAVERQYGPASVGLGDLPAPKPGSVGELFEKAAALLDERGWCQYVARNNKGEFCGHGSIIESVANGLKEMPRNVTERVPVELGKLFGGLPGELGIDNFPFPGYQTKLNPDRALLVSAEIEAHRLLTQAAENEGWKSEGGWNFEEIIEGKPYKPYKDAFAVFNDDENTTIEDVKLMMKRATELADEAGM